MRVADPDRHRSFLRSPNRRREVLRVAAWAVLAAWPAVVVALLAH